jgi:hypothetical protein
MPGLLSTRLGRRYTDEEEQQQPRRGGLLSSRLRRPQEEAAPAAAPRLSDLAASPVGDLNPTQRGMQVVEENVPGAAAVSEAGAKGFNWVTDQLSRGTYAATATIDSLATNAADAFTQPTFGKKLVATATAGWRAMWAGIKEGVVPDKKMNSLELINQANPEFVQQNPKAARVLGFVSDVAIDPLNWVSFGGSTATKVAHVTELLDTKKLTRLMQDAGIASTTFDSIAKRFGSGTRQAQRAKEVESAAAVQRAFDAQRATIRQDYLGEVREIITKHGAPALAKESPELAMQVTADAMMSAEKEVISLQRKLRVTEIAEGTAKTQERRLELGRKKLQLQGDLASAKAKRKKLREPIEAGPSPELHEVHGADPALVTDAGPLPPLVDHRMAMRGRFEEAQTKAAQRMAQLEAAREGLRGKTFNDGAELETQLGKLLGAQEKVKVTWDTDAARAQRLLSDPVVIEKIRERGGIKVAGRSVVPQEVLDRAAKITGFDSLVEKRNKFRQWMNATVPWLRGRDTPIAQNLTETVKMPDGTTKPKGEAYLEARRQFESATDAADDLSFRDAVDSFWQVAAKKGAKERLGKLMSEVDDVASGKGLGEGLKPAERTVAIQRLVREARLTDEEDAAVRKYWSMTRQMGHIEKEMQILDHLQDFYYARYYKPNTAAAARDQVMQNEAELRSMVAGIGDTRLPGAKGGFTRERQFQTVEQAQAAGYDPVFDMVASYALRATQHRRAVARYEFQQNLQRMFPDAKSKVDKDTGRMSIIGVPKEIARDLVFMGDGAYPIDSLGFHKALRVYDTAVGWFKKGATVVRPAFGVKQLPSNMLQLSLVQGAKAFDPRSMRDAWLLTSGKAKDMRLRTLVGEEIGGEQLLDEMYRNGILRNVTTEGIGPGSNPRYQDKLTRAIDNAALLKKVAPNSTVAKGLLQFTTGSFNYTDFPALVENFSRATGYINARRAGHAPVEAAKQVDKALFDYLHGLQAAETRFVKRLVPFYTYQRFALPLMADVLMHTPGRVANLAKATDAFFDAWSSIADGGELNDTQRRVLPGWLLEQPAAFEKFTSSSKVLFRTFNNFSPLDVIGQLAPGGGDASERETGEFLRKVGMAQLVPYIKVPLELMFEKDAFTGRELETNGLRDLNGKIEPQKFMGWAATGVTATLTGGDAKLAALAGFLGHKGAETSPQAANAVLNFILGWEDGVNPHTGERTTYVSPYRWHVYTSLIPSLNDALRLSKDDRSVTDKTLHTVFGIGTVERDLEEERERRLGEMKRAEDEVAGRAADARERELYLSAAKAEEELAELIRRNEEEWAAMQGSLGVPQ